MRIAGFKLLVSVRSYLGFGDIKQTQAHPMHFAAVPSEKNLQGQDSCPAPDCSALTSGQSHVFRHTLKYYLIRTRD